MIHDDDIEPGTRCLWFEFRERGQKVISTITEVQREADGHVRAVYARSETGDFGRMFVRDKGEEYFLCGRFLLFVGRRARSARRRSGAVMGWYLVSFRWGQETASGIPLHHAVIAPIHNGVRYPHFARVHVGGESQ